MQLSQDAINVRLVNIYNKDEKVLNISKAIVNSVELNALEFVKEQKNLNLQKLVLSHTNNILFTIFFNSRLLR